MSYTDPNFTIVTSGGCNSFCSFCTDPYKRKAAPDYLDNLKALLHSDYIPDHFHQVSITGGEPTLSPDLKEILEAVSNCGKFDKVVLTTNGAKLVEVLPLIIQHVHFLNVSRHAVGYESNTQIFGTRDIITDEDLVTVCEELHSVGIPVNLNFVYGPQDEPRMTPFYINMMVGYAKALGATSISFRFDQNSNEMGDTFLEKRYAHLPVVVNGACPVCRSHTVMMDDFPVTFKASFAEPSNAINDVFELIYHITGKLTTDWEGNNEFNFARRAKYLNTFDPTAHPPIVNPQAKITPKIKPKHATAKTEPVAGHKREIPIVVPKAQTKLDTQAVEKAKSARNATLVVDNSYAMGGSCGSFGGSCGTASIGEVPVAPKADTGGTCGSLGGSCGSLGGSCGQSESSKSADKTARNKPRAKAAINQEMGGSCGSMVGGGCGANEPVKTVKSDTSSPRFTPRKSYGGSCGFGGSCGVY